MPSHHGHCHTLLTCTSLTWVVQASTCKLWLAWSISMCPRLVSWAVLSCLLAWRRSHFMGPGYSKILYPTIYTLCLAYLASCSVRLAVSSLDRWCPNCRQVWLILSRTLLGNIKVWSNLSECTNLQLCNIVRCVPPGTPATPAGFTNTLPESFCKCLLSLRRLYVVEAGQLDDSIPSNTRIPILPLMLEIVPEWLDNPLLFEQKDSEL